MVVWWLLLRVLVVKDCYKRWVFRRGCVGIFWDFQMSPRCLFTVTLQLCLKGCLQFSGHVNYRILCGIFLWADVSGTPGTLKLLCCSSAKYFAKFLVVYYMTKVWTWFNEAIKLLLNLQVMICLQSDFTNLDFLSILNRLVSRSVRSQRRANFCLPSQNWKVARGIGFT